ncbi:MAG TPA: sugar ABC transporter permease [Mycobacteriales bacterium]|nr:sugar ABC transporter permease [Mycobacteriales bacterium]
MTQPVQAGRSARGERRRGRAGRGDSRLALWLIAPTVVALALVIGYPVVRALWQSTFSDSITGNSRFIGIGNYRQALTGPDSSDFWAAFRFTSLFAVVTLFLEVAIGMAMALIMNRAFRGRALLRTSVLVPWAIPTAVTAVLWRWMLQPEGVVNYLISHKVLWTGSEWPARWAIVVADTWKTAPFIGLLLLAGLQIIPDELYESARVDGASAWKRFVTITLPLVRPALLVAVLFRLLDALRLYDLPAILTHGANGTTSLSILVVQASIQQTKYSLGSALSTLTFLYIFIVAFFFVKVLGTNVVRTQQRAVS